jgi:hypothetical protein
METKERKFTLPLAELVDRLTIDQIKEVLLPQHRESFALEMEKLCHDIDVIIEEKDLYMTSRLMRIIIALAQLNLHIWQNKDRMQVEPDRYLEMLKFAHQLNGVRNQIKNLLLEETGDREKSAERSNFNTDGLEGWDISIL